MTIALRELDSLDPELVAQSLTETIVRVQEENASLDLRPGVLYETLVYPHAVLATQLQENLNDYMSGRSLLDIEADPALADDEMVDQVLSNFRTFRKSGEFATGDVVIVVSKDTTVTIGLGSEFESSGKTFRTAATYTAKVESEQVVLDTDRLLSRTDDGFWSFSVPVVAVEAGSASAIRKDAAVLPVVLPANYLTSYASSDFSGGLDAETNNDMLLQMQLGMAGRSLAGRLTMQSLLRNTTQFSAILRSSIIGCGDPEMLRDKHSIMPVTMGSRADWYIRSQERIFRERVSVEAVLIEKTTDSRGIWQFAVARDTVPGFYTITDIRLPTATDVVGGFPIVADIRGMDLTGTGFIPDIVTQAECAYTRFQTTLIQFQDTLTDTLTLTIGSRATYEYEARRMPLIGEIQDFISSRDVRHHGADCLVRAPIPCVVQLTLTIHKQAGEADPDTAALKDALAAEINNIGFVGRLYASQLYDVVHGFLKNASQASALDMLGTLTYPDASKVYLRSGEVLVVPDVPELQVTSRTVQFFSDPEDIGISISTSIPSDV